MLVVISRRFVSKVGYLNKMSDMVRGQLTKIERNKLVALITMEIHNR